MKINNQEFAFVRELEGFEGPILSEYSSEGKVYLEKWVDRDDTGNYLYVLTESTAEALKNYLDKKISMREVVHSDNKNFPCILVTVASGQTVVKATYTTIGELPESYLPSASAMYDETLSPDYKD